MLAGILIGGISGFYLFFFAGSFLMCGPIEGVFIPAEIRYALLRMSLYYGFIPGALIGIFGNYSIPKTMARGYFSKVVAGGTFLIVTPLAWITLWGNLHFMSAGRIAITVIMNFMIFSILPIISPYLGFLEKFREGGIDDGSDG